MPPSVARVAERSGSHQTFDPNADIPDPYLGTVVADRYRVLSKLGEGGMGVVYLAEHVIIEKRVALKILSQDFARKADLVQRFMQEAKAASRIGHENIVDITDFGETPSGSVFFAMECLEGSDLAHHVRNDGPMPWARVRYVVSQICRALSAAHAKGIIHRDMKPENVFLVEREGRPDFVKILDFGIAKMSAIEDGGSRLTRTGMIFGTPEYMSPEQAKGDRPDHRVDIYAVGCILYEMLTGDVPFHADTFMGVLTKHMFEAPMPINRRCPAANIPAAVEAVVMKALAKDRDQRFQSMKDMDLALEGCDGSGGGAAWVNESMGSASSSASEDDLEELAPPRRRLGLFILGGIAVATAGLVVALRSPHPTAPVNPVPVGLAPKTVSSSTGATGTLPSAAAPNVAAPAAPLRYKMEFNSQPSGAEIMRGAERLGTTPQTIEFDANPQPVTILLRHKGYEDLPIEMVADRPHTYEPKLIVVHGHASHSTPRLPRLTGHDVRETPEASPPQAPAAAPPPSHSNGRLRDLKDPFAQ